jgi:hypothetical protein
MSSQNGNKSRYGRLRKKKIADRVRMRALRKLVVKPAAPAPAVA